MSSDAVLIAYACDEGVRRNKGRVGAVDGPASIREALSKISGWGELRQPDDAGDIVCADQDLEGAQSRLADRVSSVLDGGGHPIVIGGGHDVAWGSYQGIRQHLGWESSRLGVINFDAHFDLRDPAGGANSGTPFRQIAECCAARDQSFPYLVLGVNPAMNNPALWAYASAHTVQWVEDSDFVAGKLEYLQQTVDGFLSSVDSLYLSICLDAFPAAVAPGVSAPGVPGICPHTGVMVLRYIVTRCRSVGIPILVFDIAEMNPTYDRDSITARLAARLIFEYLQERG